MTELVNELADVDVTCTDEELHMVVLDALPPTWEAFGSTLSLFARHQNVPTFSELENLVKEEEALCMTRAFARE